MYYNKMYNKKYSLLYYIKKWNIAKIKKIIKESKIYYYFKEKLKNIESNIKMCIIGYKG